MPKITRLEWTCLIITATVLTVTFAVMIRRQQEVPQEQETGQAGGDLQAMSGQSESRVTVQDPEIAPSDAESREFAERVRDVPKPNVAHLTPSTTNALVDAAAAVSNQVAGLVRPPRVFGTNDVMAALAKIAAMPWGPAAEQLLQNTVGKWAASDPAGALDYALGIESRRVRAALVSGVFASWAKTDLNGAYSCLLANRETSPDTFRLGLKPVFSAAAAWLLSMRPPSPSLDPSIRAFVGTIMNSNPETAVMWAGTIADPKIRNNTIMGVARQWITTDPQKAAAYIATAPLTPGQRASLMRSRP